MSYLVLARKWRPQGFDDLIGQKPIVRMLSNAIEQGKIAHAYVFSGPRGVGKTSTARILAKALNCSEGPNVSPCGKCPSCTSITEGQAVDVHEIDGASNTGVDNIRDLRERVKYAPSSGRYKVYIIDEAHMLSQGAFNALLKTLEEPPPHVIFVLATTEPRKIPLTVMSRCQHLPFRRISMQDIRDRLKLIVESEDISISDSALAAIARAADGSIRDSLTILDQVASFSAEISDTDVMDLLGASDFRGLSTLAEALLLGDRKAVIATVSDLVDKGTDLRTFTKDLIKFFRDMLVAKLTSRPAELIDASSDELSAIASMASNVRLEQISLVINELVKAESEIKASFSPRIALEMALIRTSFISLLRPVSDAVAELSSAPSPTEDVEKPKPKPETKISTAQTAASEPAPEPTPSPIPAREDPPEPISKPESAPEASETAPQDGDSLLKAMIEKSDDPRLSSKLAKASAALDGDTLVLTFKKKDAAICAEPIKEQSRSLSEIATELRGSKTRVDVEVKSSKSTRKKDVKEKAMSEPIVKEALQLFEGRVVDVRKVKDN